MNSNPDDAWDAYDPDEPSDALGHPEWDEDDWEDFLACQDALNAKYHELFETLVDHPCRDDLIARELRGNLPDGAWAPGEIDPCPDDDPLDGGPDDPDAGLKTIPAHRIAHTYARAVEDELVARIPHADRDDDACQTARAAIEVPVQIANGHGYGCDRDSLCGNIAWCKRALTSLGECFDGLLSLRKRRLLAPCAADQLLASGQHVAGALDQHIRDLRRRIWWH